MRLPGQKQGQIQGPLLGIETSCDETGVALYSGEHGLLAHALYSQVEIHAEFGGVVPELASRDHVRKILPLINKVLAEAGLQKTDIAGIAYTAGPGLLGALLVGAAVAKSLAYVWKIPAIGVHHMEGHLLAPMLEPNPPAFPFVALLVSGGHTQLVDVKGIGEYVLLGESLDDAAGEAFDKTAKLLGLGYPGGPQVAKCAEHGNPDRFQGQDKFPRPMCDRPGLDFSFSGLKTYTLNTWQASAQTEQDKADIACAFQTAVVDTIAIKCKRALEQTGYERLVIAGGVSANTALRDKLGALTTRLKANVYYPRLEFCTDNGAMIAFAGYQRLAAAAPGGTAETGDFVSDLGIHARARWPLTDLTPA